MYLDDCFYLLSDLTWLPLFGVGRKSWYIITNVFVIFLFFWTDNSPCPPHASNPGTHILKNFNIHLRKKKIKWKLCRIWFYYGCCSSDFLIFLNGSRPLPAPIPPTQFEKLLISIIEIFLNEYFVEFYFSVSTVLVFFSFFRTDNVLACAAPPL